MGIALPKAPPFFMSMAEMNALFKERYALLLTDTRLFQSELLSMFPFQQTELVGRQYHVPVVLDRKPGVRWASEYPDSDDEDYWS